MIFILLISIFARVHAYSSGAPEKVCNTMMPKHGGGILPQASAPSYKITTKPNNLGILVTIESPEAPFEGFMLQARDPQGNIVGTFDPIDNFARTMNCDGSSDNSLTHTSANQKENLKIQWHPNGYEGPLIFKYVYLYYIKDETIDGKMYFQRNSSSTLRHVLGGFTIAASPSDPSKDYVEHDSLLPAGAENRIFDGIRSFLRRL